MVQEIKAFFTLSPNLANKVIAMVLTAMLPFLILGTINTIRDHERISLIRETYISTESVRVLMQEMHTQNELLRSSTLDTKEDVLELKLSLEKVNDRIDKILYDNRSSKNKTTAQLAQ